MTDHPEYRIRLRLNSGAELEASGTAEFVRAEREAFVSIQLDSRGSAATALSQPATAKQPSWESITESKGQNIQLRGKLRGDKNHKDACLVLLAAAHTVLNQPKPTAAQIARWLRASGYPVQRVDRAIAEGLEKGEIMASGSRRARRYELTGPGRVKAFLLAEQLSAAIAGL